MVGGVGTPPWPPLEDSVDGGSAWVDLESVGTGDESDDGGFADG